MQRPRGRGGGAFTEGMSTELWSLYTRPMTGPVGELTLTLSCAAARSLRIMPFITSAERANLPNAAMPCGPEYLGGSRAKAIWYGIAAVSVEAQASDSWSCCGSENGGREVWVAYTV